VNEEPGGVWPPRPYRRGGLSYYPRSEDGQRWFYTVRPSAPITVDGILYQRPRNAIQPMIRVKYDTGISGAVMQCSDPPTEEELDGFLRTGILRGLDDDDFLPDVDEE